MYLLRSAGRRLGFASTESLGPPTSTSVHNVLNTPELLHSILLQVDARTLLTSVPLVCRQWHQTTQDSTAIKRTLFLEPETEGKDNDEGPRRVNPILVEKFCGFLGEQGSKLCKSDAFSGISLADKSRRPLFMRLDASWRRMLVTQPPIRELLIVTIRGTQARSAPTRSLDTRTRVSFPDGLRMGDLYDLAVDWMQPIWLAEGFQLLKDQSAVDEWEVQSDCDGGGNLPTGQRGKFVKAARAADAVFIRMRGCSCFMGIPSGLHSQIERESEEFKSQYAYPVAKDEPKRKWLLSYWDDNYEEEQEEEEYFDDDDDDDDDDDNDDRE